MKKLILFLCFALLISNTNFAQSSGTLSGSFCTKINCTSGLITCSNTTDTYQITMPYDGRIEFTGTVSSSQAPCNGVNPNPITFSIITSITYVNNDGNTLNQGLGSVVSSDGSITLETNCLMGGKTIDIAISMSSHFGANNTGSYSINYVVPQLAYANDIEPNDDFTQAIVTSENTFYEGHAGNFIPIDSTPEIEWIDWYKLTVPRNGTLNVTANLDAPEGMSNIGILVFKGNSDGTLASGGLNQFNTNNVVNGTINFSEYCVQQNDVLYFKFTGACDSYQLSWNVQEPTGFIDTEPNNNNLEAIAINDGETKTGNVGNGINAIIGSTITTEDFEDWYKFTLPTSGGVNIDITSSIPLPISPVFANFIFRALPDGSIGPQLSPNQMSGNQTNGFTAPCLAAGTYYIRINDNSGSGICSECCVTYTLTVNFNNAATFQADAEPNNSFTNALFVAPNVNHDGQLWYFSDGSGNDNIDVYELVMNFNGGLSVNFTQPMPQGSVQLFYNTSSQTGTINLDANNMITSISYACAAEGESYFLRVLSNTCMSYQFNYTNTMIDVNNELEPNGNVANAQQISEFDLLFGQVNYGSPGNIDLSDNYELLSLTSAPLTYNFDLNGDMTVELIRFDTFIVTSVTQDQNSGNINSISFNNIDANNTYYLRLKSTDCTDYWLNGWTQGFTGTNDSEPNNDVANTIPINFAQNYQGHLSFINSGSDIVDYYSFTLPLTDDVQFILNAFEGLVSTATLTLFNSNGTQVFQLAQDGTNTARTSNIVNLTAGDYYFTITGTTETGSYDVKVTPQTTLSITDNSLDNLVVLFPNPAKDIINISLANTLNTATTNIYDVTGKLILNKNLNSAESQIDISQLQTGIYFIKIKTENASTTKRFIKQ
jgi:Secretion system C-terminal sorting domain